MGDTSSCGLASCCIVGSPLWINLLGSVINCNFPPCIFCFLYWLHKMKWMIPPKSVEVTIAPLRNGTEWAILYTKENGGIVL